MVTRNSVPARALVVCLLGTCAAFTSARAHCDTLDGPVVVDARLAFEKGDPTPVLKWVRVSDEAEVRGAFRKALAARAAGDDARALAETWFFETLVRVHRAGEGAPYTGLKPAGSVEPSIAAADRALQAGSVDALADAVAREVRQAVLRRFAIAAERRAHASDSVDAGRAFVAAYVEYVHFVEEAHRLLGAAPAERHEH